MVILWNINIKLSYDPPTLLFLKEISSDLEVQLFYCKLWMEQTTKEILFNYYHTQVINSFYIIKWSACFGNNTEFIFSKKHILWPTTNFYEPDLFMLSVN